MTPQTRRRLIPFLVLLAASSVLFVVIIGKQNTKDTDAPIESTTPVVAIEQDETVVVVDKEEAAPPATAITPPSIAQPIADVEGIGLVRYENPISEVTLGALDEVDKWKMEVKLTRAGAGISSIRFSDIFETVDGKLDYEKYRNGSADKPSDEELYLLAVSRNLHYATPTGEATAVASVLGANQIVINGTTLHLTSPLFWDVSNVTKSTVSFEATVVDSSGDALASITRAWTLNDQYGLQLAQFVTNLGTQNLEVEWVQYGPPSLTVDRSRYMDRRRFRFGWELSDEFDPSHAAPIQSNDILFEYTDATKDVITELWPTEETIEEDFKLSWFASTNRYFSIAVYPPINSDGKGNRVFTDKITRITSEVYGKDESEFILTALWSPKEIVPAGETLDLSMGVYAGPLKRSVLDNAEPFISLNMRSMVLYQMSSMCAICTFQWLADFLATVLTFLDKHVVFDWGFAIILLVLCVRGLLHPITKKSQINMQRFGKVMQTIKPEIDKLKVKYPDDPKKVQSEQMKLMQKYGVNPLQMLGCLPMFLQMPIWIALYALLYFMFDIRQEPAFFGFFQLFGDWPFLADLSASDHFFGSFEKPKHFFLWNITGINVLPILMGVIFFIQQKYMSPQSMASTPEQQSQQKIMRIMMVVMFPLMLYSAPSGLTLYILTSSTVGILESRHIRKHIDSIPIEPKTPNAPTDKGRKPKDKQGRAWADAMDARRKKVQNKAKKRNFKKRD